MKLFVCLGFLLHTAVVFPKNATAGCNRDRSLSCWYQIDSDSEADIAVISKESMDDIYGWFRTSYRNDKNIGPYLSWLGELREEIKNSDSQTLGFRIHAPLDSVKNCRVFSASLRRDGFLNVAPDHTIDFSTFSKPITCNRFFHKIARALGEMEMATPLTHELRFVDPSGTAVAEFNDRFGEDSMENFPTFLQAVAIKFDEDGDGVLTASEYAIARNEIDGRAASVDSAFQWVFSNNRTVSVDQLDTESWGTMDGGVWTAFGDDKLKDFYKQPYFHLPSQFFIGSEVVDEDDRSIGEVVRFVYDKGGPKAVVDTWASTVVDGDHIAVPIDEMSAQGTGNGAGAAWKLDQSKISGSVKYPMGYLHQSVPLDSSISTFDGVMR